MTKRKRSLLLMLALTVESLLLSFSAHSAETFQMETIGDAGTTLKQVLYGEEGRIPPQVLRKANGLVIIPNVDRSHASGVLSGRAIALTRDSTTGWSYPVFAYLSGGVLRGMIESRSADIILVLNDPGMVHELTGDDIELGDEASQAAGPILRDGAADDADLGLYTPEVLSYVQRGETLKGEILEEGVLKIDSDATVDLYKDYNEERISHLSIFTGKDVHAPPKVEELRRMLSDYEKPGKQ